MLAAIKILFNLLAGLPYLLRQAIMTELVVILLGYVATSRLIRLFYR